MTANSKMERGIKAIIKDYNYLRSEREGEAKRALEDLAFELFEYDDEKDELTTKRRSIDEIDEHVILENAQRYFHAASEESAHRTIVARLEELLPAQKPKKAKKRKT